MTSFGGPSHCQNSLGLHTKGCLGYGGPTKKAASMHNSIDLPIQKPIGRRGERLPEPQAKGPMERGVS